LHPRNKNTSPPVRSTSPRLFAITAFEQVNERIRHDRNECKITGCDKCSRSLLSSDEFPVKISGQGFLVILETRSEMLRSKFSDSILSRNVKRSPPIPHLNLYAERYLHRFMQLQFQESFDRRRRLRTIL